MPKSPKIHDVLHDTFGIEEFREGQEEVIRQVRRGRDIFARMPTGSGKSLCFQLPAVMEPEKTTLVISPLIALMRDQVRGLVARNIAATDFNSSYEPDARTKILEGIRAGVFRLVYAAPEQLTLRDFRGAIEEADISRLVVDEAHCVSQWGHDFRPSYRNIEPFAQQMYIEQILAFTATASTKVVKDVERTLSMEKPYEFLGNVLRPNLNYKVIHSEKMNDKARVLLKTIRENMKHPGGILIYCATRREVIRVFDFLSRKGLPVGFYHAGMPSDERKTTEQNFYKNEKRILVATNAFGMGVDKPDIRTIVHFNIPGSIESYIQETGRAGRDGKPAHCVLLYYPIDRRTQQFLQEAYKPQMGVIRLVYTLLRMQAKRAAGEDGWFEFQYGDLQASVMRTRQRRRGNYAPSWQPMINAAIGCLQEFGVIELQKTRMRLHALEKKEVIEDYIAQRKAEDTRKLEAMVNYAEHGRPTQELLIELLEAA